MRGDAWRWVCVVLRGDGRCAAMGRLPGQRSPTVIFATAPSEMDTTRKAKDGGRPLGHCGGYNPAGCWAGAYANDARDGRSSAGPARGRGPPSGDRATARRTGPLDHMAGLPTRTRLTSRARSAPASTYGRTSSSWRSACTAWSVPTARCVQPVHELGDEVCDSLRLVECMWSEPCPPFWSPLCMAVFAWSLLCVARLSDLPSVTPWPASSRPAGHDHGRQPSLITTHERNQWQELFTIRAGEPFHCRVSERGFRRLQAYLTGH